MNRFFAVVLLAFGLTGAAHAIPLSWTDSVTNFANGGYVHDWNGTQYTHDLTDNGFNPLTDHINDFNLSISLADDNRPDIFGIDIFEWTKVDLPGSADDWSFFGMSSTESGGLSVEGLAQLNSQGTLTVTIRSLIGDFYLVGSTLTAFGERQAANVPEPGALGLLGIGLVGLALSKRRRKQAAA